MCPGQADPVKCRAEEEDLQVMTKEEAWKYWCNRALADTEDNIDVDFGDIGAQIIEVFGVNATMTNAQLQSYFVTKRIFVEVHSIVNDQNPRKKFIKNVSKDIMTSLLMLLMVLRLDSISQQLRKTLC